MTSRRLLFLLPLVLLAAAGAGFWAMLAGMQRGSFDPRGVPSALIGRPAPTFTLPALEGSGKPGFSSEDLRAAAREGPVLVNFFASWCIPCLVEHPHLMRLAAEGVPVFGINYRAGGRDDPGAVEWLRRHGDPYRRIGVDHGGRVAIDFGTYGVPETYLIDREGIIRWRMAGPITDQVLTDDLRPLLRRYR